MGNFIEAQEQILICYVTLFLVKISNIYIVLLIFIDNDIALNICM